MAATDAMCGIYRHTEERETAEGKTAKESNGNAEPHLSYAGAQQPVPNHAARPQTLPVPVTMPKTNCEGEDMLTILGIYDHGQALVFKLGKDWPSAFTWGTVDGKGCCGWLQPETSRIRNEALSQMKADPRVNSWVKWIEDKKKSDRELKKQSEERERAAREAPQRQERQESAQDWGDHHSYGSGGGGSGGGWGD
jgi:hypothetical protein